MYTREGWIKVDRERNGEVSSRFHKALDERARRGKRYVREMALVSGGQD